MYPQERGPIVEEKKDEVVASSPPVEEEGSHVCNSDDCCKEDECCPDDCECYEDGMDDAFCKWFIFFLLIMALFFVFYW